ncbi:MAG: hypothetical protein M1833_001503 [Piccolia ochrophora]|nr:MAG: hypothetical protein M1833_001503 [Piccolia ochrophora]
MVGKRKASTRAQVESPPKAQPSTPSDENGLDASPSRLLPTKLDEGQPLPTLGEPQPEDLDAKDYQSVAESGILAASLYRSRAKWLSEGIFERYWTKPSKRKGHMAAENPPKESMTKLGPCTFTIEPHVFEAVLYTVKEPQPKVLSPSPAPAPASSAQRPILQFGPPGSTMAPPAQSHYSPQQQQTFQVSSQPPTKFPDSKPSPEKANTKREPSATAHQRPGPPISRENSVTQTTSAYPPGGPVTTQRPPAPPISQTGKPSPDPVIQMLATRAATDHDLKALMRVVASGKASSAQLKIFQSHIDELTAILQSQSKAKKDLMTDRLEHPSGRPSSASVQSQDAGSPSQPNSESQHKPGLHPGQATKPFASMSSSPSVSSGMVKTESSSSQLPVAPYPLMPKSKGLPLPSKPEVTAVVFEFSAGSGDRFLFPKYSILEYLPGGQQVVASFLVVRKGSSSDSGHCDPDLDYYQPINMRISAANARTLEPFARVVEKSDEVRKYMNDVMDNMTRAEYVHVAMRLPRESQDLRHEEEDEEEHEDEQERSLKAIYAPPGSIGPPVKKVVKTTSFSADRASAEPWTSPGPSLEKQLGRTRRGRVADPNKACHLCHTSSTSLWRKADIEGESVTVCNACGIKWKTNAIRAQEAAHGQLTKKTRAPNQSALMRAQQSPPPPSSSSPLDATSAPTPLPAATPTSEPQDGKVRDAP